MSCPQRFTKNIAIFFSLVVLFLFQSPIVFAITTTNDLGAVITGTPYYDPGATSGCSTQAGSGTSNAILTGSDNVQKAFNYFRSKGLDDMHTAAVMGNLEQESHLDPQIMEKGGDSQNPADADPLGWGIAQWTPGSKITGIAQSLNITGPIYELSTQLDIVWAEMQGTSPTGVQNVTAGLNQTTTIDAAVEYFRVNFEGGTPGRRLEFAQNDLTQYGGGATSSSSTTSSGCSNANLSPDCQGATGSAQILCAAKKYDPVSYSESLEGGHQGGAAWHQSCPVIGPSCVLDCSGLVNIAIYDVYGVDLRENTFAEVSDTQYWRTVPLSQVQPGDLIQPNSGHVEIVDHVTASNIYTFGSHTSSVPQPDQVSPSIYPISPEYVYLHYVGPGSH